MTVVLTSLSASEILDSRGKPTLWVAATLDDGRAVHAGVPSGASTGSREAVELRDHDPSRFDGNGVGKAAANVDGPIADALCGHKLGSLAEVDATLVSLDGTSDRSRLGSNAIVGASIAAARAFALVADEPLWRSLAPPRVAPRTPVPHFNVVNGGAHAANPLDFQEFMLAPLGAPNLPEAVRAGAEIYSRLRGLLRERGLSTGLGDEGGFAPELSQPEDALALIVRAIGEAGYRPGPDGVAIALDPAANGFFRDGEYTVAGESLSSAGLIDYYSSLVDGFPIWSIEDGMAETDLDGWRALTEELGGRVQLVGDDVFVTSPSLIAAAARSGIANAALIKVNQVGTVTETLSALAVCREAGYQAMVSHRSGETPDPFIADLAVASGCGQIKSGAPARGERVAKYNRLLEISASAPRLEHGLPRRP